MNDLLASAIAILDALVVVTPTSIGGLQRLTTAHENRIRPRLEVLRRVSRHTVDGRAVDCAHADLVAQANAVCMGLLERPRAVDSFGYARLRDYAEKVRPELEHEAALVAMAPRAVPGQPSRDRQNDIITAIRNAGTPLQRPELIAALRLESEGRLGAHLAWMVRQSILIRLPPRGYWPATDPLPV